jgi:hypothetical protein
MHLILFYHTKSFFFIYVRTTQTNDLYIQHNINNALEAQTMQLEHAMCREQAPMSINDPKRGN